MPFSFYSKTSVLNGTTGLSESISSQPVEAYGSIQPVDREELHQLMTLMNGGMSIREAIIIYTSAPLVAGSLGETRKTGSIVVHKGIDWRVVEVEDWGSNGHVEAIAVRLDNQQG
jgi:hypothetical protein